MRSVLLCTSPAHLIISCSSSSELSRSHFGPMPNFPSANPIFQAPTPSSTMVAKTTARAAKRKACSMKAMKAMKSMKVKNAKLKKGDEGDESKEGKSWALANIDKDESKKATDEKIDQSPNTRQQSFVFQGMLPQFEKTVQDAWKELNDRKGERGIQGLKNALKNKVVRKDCDWRLSTDNVKPFKACELWTSTKEGSKK